LNIHVTVLCIFNAYVGCADLTPSRRHACPPRRYLPSFPTRRSSDLGDPVPHHPGRPLHRAAAAVSGAVCHHRPHGGPVHPAGGQDRKSTRLNSSHVSISYAVFCLKTNNLILTPQRLARSAIGSTAHN